MCRCPVDQAYVFVFEYGGDHVDNDIIMPCDSVSSQAVYLYEAQHAKWHAFAHGRKLKTLFFHVLKPEPIGFLRPEVVCWDKHVWPSFR